MIVQRAYKTELDPNNRQRTALLRHAGAARWAYNWGLRKKIDAYKATGKSPSAFDLIKELVKLKRTPAEAGGVPWMYEISSRVPSLALRDLDQAFQNFFRRCRNGDKRKGFPRFKSRRRGVGNFRLCKSSPLAHDIRVTSDGRRIQLPRLGKIRLKEVGYLPGRDQDSVRIVSATVSERAGRWFVSLGVEQEQSESVAKRPIVIGVDVGIKHMAVLSDGTVFENPKALAAAERRLRLLQKSVSRKRKGSENRKKAIRRVARQHYRVACVRRDAIHKATTAIVERASVIVIEDLNVKGMLKNWHLAKALSDAAMSEFHRQLEYKARWAGVTVVKADRWFPSSKMCSRCGNVKADLSLSDRTYRCEVCGLVIDRDLNASINLENLAVSPTVTACGEIGSGSALVGRVKLASVKQEPNVEAA